MVLGCWDSALFKSLFISSLFIPAAYLFDLYNSNDFLWSEVHSFFVLFLLYFCAFVLTSIVGWLFIGFPTHWLVCKFTSKNYVYYALLPGLFLCESLLTNGPWLLAFIALTQALLFRFYVFKIKYNQA
ncbi:hypothetical protein N483_18205 [Pseudoalteromonas luteoviolacea NCIMB 1944]|uniref:Uncharacterized protein n=1 Tax=Pseudoalteromonas luteoviolacea (strain 2ta16) TaxID=1353533 RepID=V4HNY0_PSEL2|nr:hypothetical protein PL2TA16_00272 [Pseudoalteromonas luteoviolacea 2ta16]KZN40122.1 hypothetical protein N483_18205 [Pseudoalteromonas luteoviolacea NCIMB 1944]